ncbi:MAG: serine/threonine protein phosphatase [Desulfovibrionaceae bacterium]|nr:serine/threonine protein phosphatase [Desulfovibrionaceae bacterium]
MRTALSLILPVAFLPLLAEATILTSACAAPKKHETRITVYDKQAQVTEGELKRFLVLLPEFRAWASANHEEAHPSLTRGQPDFKYSAAAAKWIQNKGWDARRFFCVMGRMAAALVVVEEGNDFKGTRPPDMPSVGPKEVDLARTHLAELLQAGGETAPKVAVGQPCLPKKP